MDNFMEEKRSRKKTTFESPTCPICGITLRENELESHYFNELEKLAKIKKIVNKNNSPQTSPSTSKKDMTKNDVENGGCSSKLESNEDCWKTFEKIKENRVKRTTKVRNCSFSFLQSIIIFFLKSPKI